MSVIRSVIQSLSPAVVALAFSLSHSPWMILIGMQVRKVVEILYYKAKSRPYMYLFVCFRLPKGSRTA